MAKKQKIKIKYIFFYKMQKIRCYSNIFYNCLNISNLRCIITVTYCNI